ncbi:hypothetical protein NQ317_010752 [Molorchus minor]|uniref:Uncharacterized protein n=1 Tax=Molorchus minor TaxID=1323400 RepID=A0ABQ9JFB8_9CUCU|nr:hypothetical protein NQ317_010752 [Molorchus minor]
MVLCGECDKTFENIFLWRLTCISHHLIGMIGDKKLRFEKGIRSNNGDMGQNHQGDEFGNVKFCKKLSRHRNPKRFETSSREHILKLNIFVKTIQFDRA